MSESAKDPVAAAAVRPQAAVERLERAAGSARAALAAAREQAAAAAAAAAAGAASPSGGAGDPGPNRVELAALAERLDTTIVKLRAALGEDVEGAEEAEARDVAEREGG